MMKKIASLLFLFVSFNCLSQKGQIISNLTHEHIESEKLRSFLTKGLIVDSTIKLQSVWVVIRVEKTGKISNLYLAGELEDKFKKILEANVHDAKAPWLKKNRNKYLWYVLPVIFGQIQPNYKPKELQLSILTQEHNFNALRDIMMRHPGHVVLIRTYKSLTNKTMEENFM
ncbi:MAG: hypothetical protein RL422_150 [Bacteroidota bacterium]|jgi:hypothetical protein